MSKYLIMELNCKKICVKREHLINIIKPCAIKNNYKTKWQFRATMLETAIFCL